MRHTPERLDAQRPAAINGLDGRATNAIAKQQASLEKEIGLPNSARIPGEQNDRLYGYEFRLSDGTAIELGINVDPATGEAVGEDKQFVEARNRLAVLRANERSRGSRKFSFGAMKTRGEDPDGHSYAIDGPDGAKAQYDEALENFVSRKMNAHPEIDDAQKAGEALATITTQELSQMSALERMAAEQKTGNKVMKFLRKHKTARLAVGLALSGIGTAGLLTGQLEVALPAFALRSAVSTTGGYLLGRTGWDTLQGWRARKKPDSDARMTSTNEDDAIGLAPEVAFERLIKLHGAEARAGSHNQKRQNLVRALADGPVHDHLMNEISFSDSPDANEIKTQVRALYGNVNPLEEERLASDQTQARKRHIAGLAGGLALGALPIVKTIGLIGFPDLGIGGGHGSEAVSHAHAASANAHEAASTSPDGATPSGGGGGGIIGNLVHEIADHGTHGSAAHHAAGTHGSAAHHGHSLGGHETHADVSIGELHVKPGGGFISSFQDKYNLTPTQANNMYYAMQSHLVGAPGTYMEGSDVRISAPGNFKLPADARDILEKHLKALHKIPGHLAGADKAGLADPKTGGITAPEGAAHTTGHVVTSAHNGGVTAPDASAAIAAEQSAHHHDLPMPAHTDGTGGVAAPHTGGVSAPNPTTSGIVAAEQLAHHHNLPMPAHTDIVDAPKSHPHTSGADIIAAEQLAHHHNLPMPAHTYVPETGLQNLTPEQEAQLKTAIGRFFHNGGVSKLVSEATGEAETALLKYVGASTEHAGNPAAARKAVAMLRHLGIAFGHNLHNVAGSTKDVEEGLATAVSGLR